jgi:hypothetical protein
MVRRSIWLLWGKVGVIAIVFVASWTLLTLSVGQYDVINATTE